MSLISVNVPYCSDVEKELTTLYSGQDHSGLSTEINIHAVYTDGPVTIHLLVLAVAH